MIDMFGGWRSHAGRIRLAFSFITVLPVAPAGAVPEDFSGENLGRAQAWFPLVGLGLGALLLGLALAGGLRFPSPVTAALVLLCHFLLTGGFHLDGLADCADGLMSGQTETEKIFAIMKDSRLGSMGAVALILVLLLKYAALQVLLPSRPAAVLLFPVLGRYAIVQLCYSCDYARRGGGLGAFFTRECGLRELGLALAIALITALAAAGWEGLRALFAVSVWAFLVACYAWHRFGGVTGDFLGFVCETGEALCLLALAAG